MSNERCPMNKKKVLVIEDEIKLARFIELEFKHEGYAVDIANNGMTGLDMFNAKKYDLILLDIMLPGMDGLELTRRIRSNSNIPIIMLTAKGETADKVAGLDSGADDYVTKPFAIEEIFARMRTALKKYEQIKSGEHEKPFLTIKNMIIDTQMRSVTVGGAEVELTKTEFDLLAYLVANKDVVLTREQILNNVWGYEFFGETNVVDVYVRYLRIKIDDRFNTKFIHTIRGVGYFAKEV